MLMEEKVTKPIEGVSEKILACAKKEFLEKGYSEASLRTIAAKADTTTGSIYSRFRDKEGLFGAIVEPAADGLIQIFLKIQEEFHAVKAEDQPRLMENMFLPAWMKCWIMSTNGSRSFNCYWMLPTVPDIRISWNSW